MSELSQQNNESTMVAEYTEVHLDWDSGKKSRNITIASKLQKNHSLPTVQEKKICEVRQQSQIELIRGAQQGSRQCFEQLARQVKERLHVYIYRLTQQHELSQEIVQDSLVEMFKVIGKLREPDFLWPWLYGIATNKLKHHYKKEHKQRTIAMSSLTGKHSPRQRQSGLENLVDEELKQIVSEAMNKLKTQHKAILIMRCYDDMVYSEIAELLGSSEVGARMLFMRAKKALQKELSRNGFGARQQESYVSKETDI